MKKAIILGGGIAGMSAAQELAERGYAVEVYEMKAIPGGKARSIPVPNTVVPHPTANRRELPGEHGFRFFPRFYKHVVDTMTRIPYGKNGSVADNLTDTTRVELARYDKPRIALPTRSPRSFNDVRLLLDDFCTLFGADIGVSREDMAFFASRVWQIITSCQERREDEYEKLDWWDFIDADARSDAYQKILGYGITRSLVAAKARLASVKTIGDIFVQLLFDIATPGPSSDRVLNGPTNDVWIDPWLDHLRQLGVQYHLNAHVDAIHCADGRIQSVALRKDGRSFEVQGDYYLAAIPVERMAKLVTPALIAAEPVLEGLISLASNGVSWMNGLQFFLTEDVPVNHGHVIYVDLPWALTSVSQKQFWKDIDLSQYGDGDVRGILSVDISEWDAPGFHGKTARQCSREEIFAEVWEQLKRSLNVEGNILLRDEYLHNYFLDPDIFWNAGGVVNEEPLLVNLINTWRLRPNAVTRIPNFFLASDYVRTYTDLATMEGANEAARRAVNGILNADGSTAPRCALWNLHEPEIFAPWRELDRIRYCNGLPWDDTLVCMGGAALNLTERAAEMLEQSLGVGLGTPAHHVRDVLGVTGSLTSSSSLSPGGLDALEVRQEFLERMVKTARALARPAGVTNEEVALSFPLAQETTPPLQESLPVAHTADPVRSGLVRILPQ